MIIELRPLQDSEEEIFIRTNQTVFDKTITAAESVRKSGG